MLWLHQCPVCKRVFVATAREPVGCGCSKDASPVYICEIPGHMILPFEGVRSCDR